MVKSYKADAVVHGVINAIVNAAVGGYVAHLLWKGFRFDWYVHHPERSFERLFVAGDVALGLFGTGVVVSLIVVGLTFLAWDKRHLRVTGDPPLLYAPGRVRTRQAHVVQTALAVGLGLAAFGFMNAMLLFVVLGTDAITGAQFFYAKIAAGAVGGFAAAFIAGVATSGNLHEGRIVKTPPDRNLLAATSLAAAKHRGTTLLLVLALTGVMAAGLADVHTDVDVADVLPRGNPNTDAAHNMSAHFQSAFTQQVTLQFHVADEATWRADNARLQYRVSEENPDNITDEVHIRAIDQAVAFIMAHPDSPFIGTVNAAELYRLLNWTIAGGRNAEPESYSIPGTDPRWSAHYAAVDDAVWRAIPDAVSALTSPSVSGASVLFLTDPEAGLTSREVGDLAIRIRDDYVRWAEENPDVAYQVFTGDNQPLFTVDIPVANAHSSELAEKDFELLLPVIAYFIAISLFIAFRNLTSVLVTFTSLAIGTTWTFGAMGYMDIALNTLNLTTVPLIMGVGIDYGIHMVNEWQHHRAEGKSNEDAFRLAGGRGALAMFVATVTTAGGLLVMVVSPSKLIAELGLLSAIAIVSAYVLTITFIPAALTFFGAGSGKRREYQPSRFVPAIARGVTKARVVVVVLVLLLAGLAATAAQAIEREEFGDPARNYLEDDPMRLEHEQGLRWFYEVDDPDVKANVLVFEGNITTPEAHAYMDAIEASLAEQERVITDTLRTLPFLMRTYLTVRDGAPGAGEYLAREQLNELFEEQGVPAQSDSYPESRREIEAILEEVFDLPIRSLAAMFTNYPDYDMGIMIFSVRAKSYEDAEEVWDQVWAAVDENEDLKPDDVTVAFVGNTATNYLFVAEQVPWIGYMSVASGLIVFGLVLAATRRFRPAIAVLSVNVLTGLLWLGILPTVDIGLAITLTLPIVFIFCIGSDYALHVAMNAERSTSMGDVYRMVGKGVFFSFVTTFGAFLIFTQISNLAVRTTMVATSLAIAVIFAATLLVMPLYYPVKRLGDGKPITIPVTEPDAHRSNN